MKSMLSKLALASLLAISAVAGSATGASATVVRPNAPQAVDPIVTGGTNAASAADRSNVQTVQYRDDRRWDRDRRDYRDRRHYRDRHWDRRHHHRRHDRHRYHRGPSVHYGWGPTYRYVEPRRAPRYAPPRARASSAHVNWCYNRYRSYRASDNTFQPYNGPRTQCYSPYI